MGDDPGFPSQKGPLEIKFAQNYVPEAVAALGTPVVLLTPVPNHLAHEVVLPDVAAGENVAETIPCDFIQAENVPIKIREDAFHYFCVSVVIGADIS